MSKPMKWPGGCFVLQAEDLSLEECCAEVKMVLNRVKRAAERGDGVDLDDAKWGLECLDRLVLKEA